MTAVTVSVEATRHLTRFEYNGIHTPHGMILAAGEVVLQEPSSPSKDADFLRTNSAPKEGEKLTYGVLSPGIMISRGIETVKDETVTVDGVTVSLTMVLTAMDAFFEKWRQEDIDNPPILHGSTPSAPPP